MLFDKSILNPPVSWTGGNKLSAGVTAPNFLKYTYPMPGYSEIKTLYMQGGSIAAIPPEFGRFIKVFLSPKIEFIVSQNFRWDTATKYADIILPACTGFERNEIVSNPGNDLLAVYDKGIPPLMESKSDLDIYNLLAQRLGFAKDLNEGNTEEDWAKKMYAKTNIPITYDEFKKKGYYVFEIPDDYKPLTPQPGMGWYYSKPGSQITGPKDGLATPTGKIEIFSTILYAHYGVNDPEIPQVPKYIQAWEGRYDPIAAKYPLQMLTEHPKYRYHEQYNEVSWFRAFYKIRGPDGYEYEPIQINAVDANARGIKNNDIVRVFNDRGQILCAAKVTERVRPGVVTVWYASRADFQNPADPTSLDKGGSSNLLTSARPMSKHAMCVGFNAMVQVERWRG
jgi:anaerobic selenocysteine-containing dehydrogenase